MQRRFQFGFEHAVVIAATAQVVLLSTNHPLHSLLKGIAGTSRAEGFAAADPIAVATAIAMYIAVACGALKAGEALRALRFPCPNARELRAASPTLISPVFIIDRSQRSSDRATAAESNRYVGSRQRRTLAFNHQLQGR